MAWESFLQPRGREKTNHKAGPALPAPPPPPPSWWASLSSAWRTVLATAGILATFAAVFLGGWGAQVLYQDRASVEALDAVAEEVRALSTLSQETRAEQERRTERLRSMETSLVGIQAVQQEIREDVAAVRGAVEALLTRGEKGRGK